MGEREKMKPHNIFWSRGFTLIELMIVVAIIVFLAVLAIPHIFKYKTKAYTAEVAINLASLHTAQQAYFAEHGQYTTMLNGEGGLGWKPAGYQGGGKEEGFYYTYGFNTPDAQEGVHYFTGKLGTTKDALGQTNASAEGFQAGAAGAIVETKKTDVWHINENRKMEHTVNGMD